MSLMNYRDLVFKRTIQILSVVLILGGCASQPKQVSQQPEAVQGSWKNSATARFDFKHWGGRERGCGESGY